MKTMPEKKATIEAQMKWLREGKRMAVLITPGERLPEDIEGWAVMPLRQGLVIYDILKVNGDQVQWYAERDRLGELLGYGVARKPEPGTEIGAVTVRSRNGVEKQAVVVDYANLDVARAAALSIADLDDEVRLEPCEKVLDGRKQDVTEQMVMMRPFTAEDLNPLLLAAQRDNHRVLAPTYVVEKGGEIVGYIGLNSLPTFQGWFDTKKVKARDSATILNMVENLCRVQGGRHLALLLPESSAFRDVIDRFGYERMGAVSLDVKRL